MKNNLFMNLFHSENCKLCDHSCCFVEKTVADCKLEGTKEELRKTKEELFKLSLQKTSLVRPDQESVINGS